MKVPFLSAAAICEGSGGHVSPYVRPHPVFRIRIPIASGFSQGQ
jgi:hypothetical protein